MRCLLRMERHVPAGIVRLVVIAWTLFGGASAAAAAEGAAQAPPPARYDSVFSDYRRFADQPVGDWREANAVVGRIGGWRAYARESQRSAPAASRHDAEPTDTPPGSAHDAHHR